MALVKGVNSYETLEAANTYFATRLDIAAWTDASDAIRTQALVTATMLLDEEAWIGEAVSDSQALAHPRNGEYFEPRLGKLAELTSAAALKRINNAQYELAYHLLNNDGLLDNIGEVDSLSIGGISLSDIRGSSKIPGLVRKLIRPLLTRGNNSWWRAN
jgi:hypothetical protein